MKEIEALDCFEKLLIDTIAQEKISFAFKNKDVLNDEDGAYIPSTRSIYILDCYNDPTIDNRKNKLFIIAHELGHHFKGASENDARAYIREICHKLPKEAEAFLKRDIDYYSAPGL